MSRRPPATDAGMQRSQRAKAQRVTPYASEFARLIAYRDTLGNEYATPAADDTVSAEARRRVPGSTFLYMRARRGKRVSGTPRRGERLRLIDMRSRAEVSASVADVNARPSMRAVYGYVILRDMEIVSDQIIEPADFA